MVWMHRVWAALAVFILLCSAAMGEGVELSMQVQESEILSEGALRALNTLLSGITLTAAQEDERAYAAFAGKEGALFSAQSEKDAAVLSTGDLTAPATLSYINTQNMHAYALETARQLGALLADWEKEGSASADLKNAGKPKTQKAYALTGDEWASVWPKVCDILLPTLHETLQDPAQHAAAEEVLRNIRITGKGTLRRYFAADGTETGAYFYAAQMHIAQDNVREVRLEYGYTPGKGLYVAFRCPNKKETRNVRIALNAKTTVKEARTTYSSTLDVRISRDGEGDTYLAETTLRKEHGRLTGKCEVSITEKRESGTQKSAWEISPALALQESSLNGNVSIAFTQGDQTVFAGEITVKPLEMQLPPMPAANAAEEAVQSRLALLLLQQMQKADPSDRQELLHYLAQENYLNGETTDLIITYDPEFSVTEEP